VVRIALISAVTCAALFESQAAEHDGETIGRDGLLPIMDGVWQDYYRACAPEVDQPWWAMRRTSGNAFDGILYVDPSLPVFAGHFPGNPILPGIVQIDWAVSTAQEAFEESPAARFSGMSQIKFKAPVAPGTWLRLTLSLAGLTVNFSYSDGATACTQGRLHYHD